MNVCSKYSIPSSEQMDNSNIYFSETDDSSMNDPNLYSLYSFSETDESSMTDPNLYSLYLIKAQSCQWSKYSVQ